MRGVVWHAKKHQHPLPPNQEDDSPVYKVGDEIDVSEATARHFINKDVAEEMTPKRQKDTPKTLDEPKAAVK